MDKDDFEAAIAAAIEESKNYETCMSLDVSREGKAVTLILDTARSTSMKPLHGEGTDIGLLIDLETNQVVGVRLPLYNERLVVSYDGPMRVNAGFLKGDVG